MKALYPVEDLNAEWSESDNGTIHDNYQTLGEHIIGHKIVSVERGVKRPDNGRGYYWGSAEGTRITLDSGKQVFLADTNDCCAYTELESFLLHPDKVDHIITGIGTTEGASKWHIYADAGDVLELSVGWSCGNPFYYGYGFEIDVVDA